MARRPRRRRAPRAQRRRGGHRLLKWLVIGLVIAVPLAYFAFTVAFFDPREESEGPFQELVPREVDLFVRRRRLDSDFATFPVPRLVDRLLRNREFQDLAESAWWQGLEWPDELEALADELARVSADAPLDPLADLLGREVVLVGRHGSEADDGQGDYALMARISDKAKFAIEALDIGFLRSRSLPDAELETRRSDELPGVEYRRLALPGEDPVFYSRRNDLLVASFDEALLIDVLGGVYGDRERSLGKSRLYEGGLPAQQRDPSELMSAEVVLDARDLLARVLEGGTPGDLGDDAGGAEEPHEDAVINLLGALFDPAILQQVAARVEVDGGDVSVAMHAELKATLGAEPHGLRDTSSFNVAERMEFVTSLLPTDVSAGITLNGETRPILRALANSFSDDVRALINDLIKGLARDSPGWRIDSIDGLIGFLDRALGSEVTLAIRPIDHTVPRGSQPLPAMVLMVPVRDERLWEELTQAVIYGFRSLGIDPDNMYRQDEGVGDRIWLGLAKGLAVEEVAFISMDVKSENRAARDVVGNRRLLVLGTDDDFVREIVAVNFGGRPPLRDTPQAQAWIGTRKRDGSVDRPGLFAGRRANMLAWGDMTDVKGMILEYADYIADEATYVDLGEYRRQEREALLRSRYPEYATSRGGTEEVEIPDEISFEIESRLDQLVAARERQWLDEEIPAFADEWSRKWAWLDLMRHVSLSLNYRATEANLRLDVETLLSTPR